MAPGTCLSIQAKSSPPSDCSVTASPALAQHRPRRARRSSSTPTAWLTAGGTPFVTSTSTSTPNGETICVMISGISWKARSAPLVERAKGALDGADARDGVGHRPGRDLAPHEGYSAARIDPPGQDQLGGGGHGAQCPDEVTAQLGSRRVSTGTLHRDEDTVDRRGDRPGFQGQLPASVRGSQCIAYTSVRPSITPQAIASTAPPGSAPRPAGRSAGHRAATGLVHAAGPTPERRPGRSWCGHRARRRDNSRRTPTGTRRSCRPGSAARRCPPQAHQPGRRVIVVGQQVTHGPGADVEDLGVQPGLGERVDDQLRGPELVVADLGVRVDVPAQLHEPAEQPVHLSRDGGGTSALQGTHGHRVSFSRGPSHVGYVRWTSQRLRVGRIGSPYFD